MRNFIARLRIIRIIPVVVLAMLTAFTGSLRAAEGDGATPAPESGHSPGEVISAFTRHEVVESEVVAIPDQKKRLIMFIMGVPLLVFILITVALGIALGVYGKRVYLPHMIFAGLSATLAIAHAVVGIVWFYPF